MDLSKRAREIIQKIKYITIATVSPEGQPWNSPVYSAFDENYNFYFVSWKENQHSKNIFSNSEVFLVIYDSTVSEGKGEGVYIQATAEGLNNPQDIIAAWKLLDERVGKVKERKPEEFMGEFPRRVFKIKSVKAWMNTDGDEQGQYVDKRVEIQL